MTNLAATLLSEPDAQRGGIIFKMLFLIFVVVLLAILAVAENANVVRRGRDEIEKAITVEVARGDRTGSHADSVRNQRSKAPSAARAA